MFFFFKPPLAKFTYIKVYHHQPQKAYFQIYPFFFLCMYIQYFCLYIIFLFFFSLTFYILFTTQEEMYEFKSTILLTLLHFIFFYTFFFSFFVLVFNTTVLSQNSRIPPPSPPQPMNLKENCFHGTFIELL